MLINSFIYLGCASFIAVYGLSLVAASRSYSAVAVHGFLIAVASLVAEYSLLAAQASVVVVHRPSYPVVWNLPGSGTKPTSLALANGFLTTGPPGKSPLELYHKFVLLVESFCELIQAP